MHQQPMDQSAQHMWQLPLVGVWCTLPELRQPRIASVLPKRYTENISTLTQRKHSNPHQRSRNFTTDGYHHKSALTRCTCAMIVSVTLLFFNTHAL